jgi:signal transduction histidine kinase
MRSLRLRLLIGAVIGIGIALSLAGLVLVRIFDDHVRQRYVKELEDHLHQLVAMIQVGPAGTLKLKQELSEPEFHRPFSGHYWQVEREGQAILRSRSLWDEALRLRGGPPEPGAPRSYELVGPLHHELVVVERLIELPPPAAATLRVAVAGDSSVVDGARQDFAGVVGVSLLILGALLAAASWLQVGAGLAPLRGLRAKLEAMHRGATQRIEGDYPVEVVGLIHDLNRLIETQAAEAERARRNAANLGHGLKTPLAVLAAEARTLRETGAAAAAVSIENEVNAVNAHVARALASARAVGRRTPPGTRTEIASVLERLVPVMKKLPGGAAIDWSVSVSHQSPAVRVDQRDIEDMLGNLLDNARKWARSQVCLSAYQEGDNLVIVVDDDGPGIPADRIDDVLARGIRLDRSIPGTGVGLSIVKDLVELNLGDLKLSASPAGGLRAMVKLPIALAASR